MNNEHPILYSTSMVRAYLEDRKGMTRRISGLEQVNVHPENWHIDNTNDYLTMRDKTTGEILPINDFKLGRPYSLICPYGQMSDTLWVRETHYIADHLYNETKVHYKANEPYYAQYENVKWRPSIHMPHWASRLTQTITSIRVERLQDISREDIRAEGIGLPPSPRFTPGIFSELHQEFASLWDSINKKRGYSWGTNPWVWVISYPKYSEEPTRKEVK